MLKKDVLPNGLRVVTKGIKDRKSVALGFWFGVGGRYESDRLKGAAHFLEHIVFKGSRKYSCQQIKELIEGVGGSLNAFTSEEQTCFYAKIPAKHFDQTFDVLSDMVTQPRITPSDVAKEKTVIVEEIKMYRDLPQYHVVELLDRLLWPGHPLGKGLAGTVDSVVAMTNKDLKGFHKAHYSPSNTVISACGALKHADIVQLAKQIERKTVATKETMSFEPATDMQTRARVHFCRKDIEQMHVAFAVPGFHERHEDRQALNLLNVILGGNMSSRLFVELREKNGLAYSVMSGSKNLHDTGAFMIRAGVDNTKILDAMGMILKELDKIQRRGVNASEFTRAKDYLLGQVLLGLEDTMDHMLWIGEGMISKNEVHTLEKVIQRYEQVTIGDIQRVAKALLVPNKYNLAVVGPMTSAQEKNLQQMLDAEVL